MTIAFVYKWTQLSTGMWYIGSRTAKGCHPDDGYICSSKFVKPLIEANPNDWLRQILMYSNNVSKIRELEAYTLQDLNAKHNPMSYNRHNNDGNFFPMIGGHSEETRRKMSKIKKGKPISEEHRQKMIEGRTGKKLGPRSEETKRKISEAQKGIPKSEEQRQKNRDAQKGRPLKEEHRRKMIGRIISEETKRKISETKKGKSMSEETKRKISETKRNKNKV